MNFKELVLIFKENFKTLVTITVVSTILLFLILTFIYPKSYRSVVTILPPEHSQSNLSSLLGVGGDLTSLMGLGAGGNSQLYQQILESRTAAEYVIRKFNLIKFYNAENEEEAIKTLQKNLDIELTKEGMLKVSVNINSKVLPSIFDNTDELKKLAANMSNSFISALDSINKYKLTTKAKKARIYLENQLEETKTSLDTAEYKLSVFQKSNKAISLPEQVKASIETAAQLKTEIVKAEIDVNMAESNLSSDNRSLLALKEKLQNLRNEYNKLTMSNQDFLIAFKDVPEVGKQLASLMREVKIQNEVYLMLKQQYYREKIQENKDISTVDVLDEAIPPLKSYAPRTIFTSALGGLTVFLVLLLYLTLKKKEYFKNLIKVENV